ncbi:MAG: NADH-quinone oxidoreductase subunit M [Rhodospirillaceae bacterium]|nr:NADH-quinone oxidoreductase subunit M [Rhodospirillaceae bacterium]
MTGWPLLSIAVFLPLLGVLFILFIGGTEEEKARNARSVALLTAVANFLVALAVWALFDPTRADFQMIDQARWLPALGMSYRLGVDGISLFFVLLSTFLTPLCILSSWQAVTVRVKDYMIAFLVLETMMVGMFTALDLVLFYVFFEGVLIPMFIIIGVWGGPRRVYAAFKFFLYTLLGSVLMLLAVLAMYGQAHTTDIQALLAHDFPARMQPWLWLAFFASFAVKVPMWPVHTWLPDAHVEAPTAGSVILAGVLLKMGGYGFLRFSLPMFPLASDFFTPLIFVLSVIAILYASLVALAQQDMKKLIAYSSIAHMGIVTIGIFTVRPQGVEGAMFQMLSHGVVSAALFLCVGVLYDRVHTREIARFGGLAARMPVFAALFMLFTLAAIGLPGTSGFIGEFLALLGAFWTNVWLAAFAALGLILGAAYMLILYRRVMFGRLEREELMAIPDLSRREIALFVPLVLVVLWMGLHPDTFLEPMRPSVEKLVNDYHLALSSARSAAAALQ